MASMYDKIETASDLISEVRAHGLSTIQEDLCRAQDIFGHTTVGELARLANDTGRNNINGEPDPNGSWSSTRPATQSTFYSIAFQIWNWEDATRFWNQNTNPEHVELAELKRKVKQLTEERDGLAAQVKHLDSLYSNEAREGKVKQVALDSFAKKMEEKEVEINSLKAKLYDLMFTKNDVE